MRKLQLTNRMFTKKSYEMIVPDDFDATDWGVLEELACQIELGHSNSRLLATHKVLVDGVAVDSDTQVEADLDAVIDRLGDRAAKLTAAQRSYSWCRMTPATKATTQFLYSDIPDAVEADPAGTPLAIARTLIARLTADERQVILEQLVSHRVQTAQVVRAHHRHQVSEHD